MQFILATIEKNLREIDSQPSTNMILLLIFLSFLPFTYYKYFSSPL